MSFLLFVDESGQDRHHSPYEVLAGVAIEDRDIWNLVVELRQLEDEIFGLRYSQSDRELKARELLKAKVFRHAGLMPPFEPAERRALAARCLTNGAGATPEEFAALGQAKLVFVERVLETCAAFRCRAFASIIPHDAPRTAGDFLRKDYAYLFERFYYFLDGQSDDTLGLVVFDELERTQSHLLVDQMERYFVGTHKGRLRSARVIPEPFFVHSQLTTGVQLADLVAYIIAWGVRLPSMTAAARPELRTYADAVITLRRDCTIDIPREGFTVWGFAVISDLRPRVEQEALDAADGDDEAADDAVRS